MHNLLRKILIIICLLISIICFGMLARCNYSQMSVIDATPTPDIQNNNKKETTTINIECGQPEPIAQVHPDFLKVQEINDDLIGLIYFEDMIYEPVVQAEDNDYYLRKNIKQEYASIGTAFMDYRVNYEADQNIIIYGHTSLITKGAMFSNLNYYKDYEFWNEHQDFEFYTKHGTDKYKVFAAYVWKPNQAAFFMGHEFEETGEYSFSSFLARISDVTIYETNVEVAADDKIITLVTCEEANINNKVVVFAVKQ